MLQKHYQLLSKMSVDSVFDADWKNEVEDGVKVNSSSHNYWCMIDGVNAIAAI